MKIRNLLALSAFAILPLTVAAQSVINGVKLVGPGRFAGTVEETATLLVTSVDPATRIIGLKRANGEPLEVVAGPEVKNLDQIKVGDNVTSRHTLALVLQS